MPEGIIDLSTLRHIRGASEMGAAASGQAVLVTLQMEDYTEEKFSIHPARVGRLVAALLFAAGVAADERRAAATGQLESSAEHSTLVDIVRVNASSAPGADHVALRMVIAEGVNLDFRIPLAVVPALQGKLAEALALAQSTA